MPHPNPNDLLRDTIGDLIMQVALFKSENLGLKELLSNVQAAPSAGMKAAGIEFIREKLGSHYATDEFILGLYAAIMAELPVPASGQYPN